MGVLIDTSVLIRLERVGQDARALVGARSEELALVSVITASELLHGVHRASEQAVRIRRSAWVEAVLAQIPILPIDLETSRIHARLWSELVSGGNLIGSHDLWIAASAVTWGLQLATLNVRDFARVPGLVVQDWSENDSSTGT